jgi:hypothetical protein
MQPLWVFWGTKVLIHKYKAAAHLKASLYDEADTIICVNAGS